MYKEQKLKANHNQPQIKAIRIFVVIKCTKNKSWKQITTNLQIIAIIFALLSNVQRTKVESKSQLLHDGTYGVEVVIKCTKNKSWKQITTYRLYRVHKERCYQMYKEQKLKANHNLLVMVDVNCTVVIKCTKNKSWKQITTYIWYCIYI